MRFFSLTFFCFLLLAGCSGEKKTDTKNLSSQTSAVAAARAVHFNVRKSVSPKGVKFWYVTISNAPVVSVNLSVKRAGDAYDPEDKIGVGNILAQILYKGSKKQDEKEFQAFLEDHAANFGVSCGTDDFSVSLTALKEDFDDVVGAVGDLFRNPRFDPKDLAFIQEQEITSLALRRGSMRYQLSKIMKKTLYADHPYGRVPLDSPEEIKRITPQDLRAKLGTLRHDQAMGVVVGPIDEAQAAAYLDKIIPDSVVSENDRLKPVATYKVQKNSGHGPFIVPEKVPQSTALMVIPGITTKSKEALAFQLLLQILERRLWNEVREKRGLAYVVSAYPRRMDKSGTVQVLLGTDKRQVTQALEVVKDVMGELYEKGVTDDELTTFVRMADDAHPMAFITTSATSSVLHGYQLQGRSHNYVNKRFEKLQTVTVEALNKLAQKYLNPADMHVFIHGIPEN